MKNTYIVPFFVFLCGCGHMAPYSEIPLDYVELYDGVQHKYQLRVPYRVQVYDFPLRSYVSSDWITLDGSGKNLYSETSENLTCPEGAFTFASRYPMRGRVILDVNNAVIQMEILLREDSGATKWQSYKFNGKYRLLRIEHLQPKLNNCTL